MLAFFGIAILDADFCGSIGLNPDGGFAHFKVCEHWSCNDISAAGFGCAEKHEREASYCKSWEHGQLTLEYKDGTFGGKTSLICVTTRASLAFGPAIIHDANPKLAKIKDANVDFVTESLEVFLVGVFELIELFEALVEGLQAVFEVTDRQAKIAKVKCLDRE